MNETEAMNETLVIIDMQPQFGAANCPRTLEACKREIRHAMQECNGIVYVKYEGHGQIHRELTDLTLLYSHKVTVTKKLNDGSKQVVKYLSQRGFAKEHIRICGVNAQWCVAVTTKGLKSLLPHSRLIAVADAINCVPGGGSDIDHRKWVLRLIEEYGVEVVNRHLLVPEKHQAA
jgi:hypothetical protein